MLLTRIQFKQGESRLYTIDYSPWLQDGETVAVARAAVAPVTTPALTATAQPISGTEVSVLFGDGLVGSEYTVEVEIDTAVTLPNIGNTGQTRIDCIAVAVAEVCAA